MLCGGGGQSEDRMNVVSWRAGVGRIPWKEDANEMVSLKVVIAAQLRQGQVTDRHHSIKLFG